MRILFDDAIDADVLATSVGLPVASSGQFLSDRIRQSAFVVPVVIVTVTNERDSRRGQTELELMPVDRPIRGSLSPYFPNAESIRVRLRSSSNNESELVGKKINLCWARFSDGGAFVDHWHGLSDAPKTKLAIAKAAAIINFD
jgi:hypothetical protein